MLHLIRSHLPTNESSDSSSLADFKSLRTEYPGSNRDHRFLGLARPSLLISFHHIFPNLVLLGLKGPDNPSISGYLDTPGNVDGTQALGDS